MNKWSRLITFSLFFLFTACGVKLDKTVNQPLDISILHQLKYCDQDGDETSEITQDVSLLRERIVSYLRSKAHYNDYLLTQRYQFHKETFQDPMILGVESFKNIFEEIKGDISRLFDKKYNDWFYGKSTTLPEDLSIESLHIIMMKINGLQDYVYRWDTQKCALLDLSTKKKNDLYDYLFLNRSNWKSTLPNFDSEVKESINALCFHLYSSNLLCREKYDKAQKEGTLDLFVETLQSSYKEKFYDPYFGFKSQQKFECKVVEGVTLIYLKFFESDFFNNYIIDNALRDYWKGANIRLVPKFVKTHGADVAVIIPTDKLSHVVNGKKNEIHLSNNLSGKTREMVLAHEVGHFIGFNDCYVEYYDSDRKEITYYELDPNNLMCSLKNINPMSQSSLEKIVEKSCLF